MTWFWIFAVVTLTVWVSWVAIELTSDTICDNLFGAKDEVIDEPWEG